MPSFSPRIEELKRKFDENPRRYFAPLANEYRKAGDVQEAIRICRAHLPQQPGHMSGHIVFGQALFEAGELDESHEVFEAALQLDPENLIALRHLGDIARARGELTSARHWYERVLDADPRNEEIAAQIDSLDAETGNAPAASSDGGATGWGDINPEASSPAAPAARPVSALAGEELPTLLVEVEMAASSAPPAPAAPAAAPDEEFPELDALGASPAAQDSSPHAALDRASVAGPAAETAPPAISASAPNDLGLEVMEFVPPSREAHAPMAELQGNAHAADTQAPDADATPAAFVTETMAELYLQQGFRQEALNVYRQLLSQNPDDENLRDRVHQLEHGGRSSFSVAEISEEIAEQAQRRQSMPTPSSVRAFFGRLAARRAPRGGEDAWGEERQTLAPEPPMREMPAPEASAAPIAEPTVPPQPAPAAAPDESSAPSYLNDWGGVLAEREDAASAPAESTETRDWDIPERDAAPAAEAEPSFGGYAPRGATPGQGLPSLDSSLPFIDTGAPSAEEAPAPEATGGADYDVSAFEIASYESSMTASHAPAPAASSDDGLAGLGGMELAEPDEAGAREADAGAMSSGSAVPGGSVDALFGGAAVSRDDEAAASALAGVFTGGDATGRPSDAPSGRPTRAANNEISLDSVFRDPTRKPEQRRSSGFSFDQFFSEAAGGTASASPTPPAGAEQAPDASADIEQFNAWLEGLKKK